MNYDLQLLKTLIYFIFIIIMILAAAKIFQKYFRQQKQGKYVDIIEQMYLGQKQYLSLIKVNDKIFLLSVGSDQVEKIGEWPADEFENINHNDSQSFKDKLEGIINKSWRDTDE